MTITKEDAKELLPIIQALVEGKEIQDKIEGLTDWVDTDEINIEYEGQKIKHRIKPGPKYRPFKNMEECWKEMQKHQPFGWIKMTNSNEFLNLISLGLNTEFEPYFIAYTFADSSPFGIKEE